MPGRTDPAGRSISASLLRNRDIWLLSAAFGCFAMAGMGFGTYLPTYLTSVRGLSLQQAALIASVAPLLTIFSAPAGGVLSDRFGSRKRPFMLGFLLMSAVLPLAPLLPTGALVGIVAAQGLINGLVPSNIFSAAVDAAHDERLSGMAMGIIMFGQNAGMLAGPVIFGALAGSPGGWPMAYACLPVMLLVGAAAGLLTRVK